MRIAPVVPVVLLLALAGCTLITGANDLKTEPSFGSVGGTSGTSGTSGGGDGGGSSSGTSGTSGSSGTSGTSGTSGGLDAGSDGASGGRIREITFESGSLTGPNGADTVTGTPVVTTNGALRGTRSMAVSAGSSFVEASFAPTSELYASFVFNVSALPPGGAYVTIARFSFTNSGTTLDVAAASGAGLRFSTPNSTFTLNTVVAGVTYRVGLHFGLKNGATSLDVQLVEGATTAFGGTGGGGKLPIGTLGTAERVAFGDLDTAGITGVFDHMLLDSLAMPGP